MKVQVDEVELKKLQRAAAKLNALENGGVDNWEWYDESLKHYRANEEYEEKLEHLLTDLEGVLLNGAYEPSERGAGYAATDSARNEALNVLKIYKVKFGDSE